MVSDESPSSDGSDNNGIEETTCNKGDDIAKTPTEKPLLEHIVMDYDAIMHIPKHAASLINDYLNTTRPSKKSPKREVYDGLESAIMSHLENKGEDEILLVHNANNDHSLYNPHEPLSKQFNRILYKRMDNNDSFDKNEKAEMLSKLVQDYAAYTAENGGFNPADFVKAAKKANVYISRNVNNCFLKERLPLKVSLYDGRLAFYANRNISGLAQEMQPKSPEKTKMEEQIVEGLEKIAEKRGYTIHDNNNAYYPVKEKKGLWERVQDAYHMAMAGFRSEHDSIGNLIVAPERPKSQRRPFWQRKENMYTHIKACYI
jgi:hypothetical protein